MEDAASVRGVWGIQVARLSAGGWAVAEFTGPGPASTNVLQYDGAGAFEGYLGVAGSGPLELSSPLGVVSDPTDSTWVADRRGRWIVFGPDGEPARALQAPTQGPIHGFTPSGLPFQVHRTMEVTDDGSQAADPLVMIWSRDGEPAETAGPGSEFVRAGGAAGRSSRESLLALNDSVFVYPRSRSFAGEEGVPKWSGESKSLWISFDSLFANVDLEEGLADSVSLGHIASDGEGGFWLLGFVRRLSSDDTRALAEELGIRPAIFGNEPRLKEATFDGIIWHIGGDRSVTASRVINEFPEGFSGENEFFVLQEDATTGLRTLRVVGLGLAC